MEFAAVLRTRQSHSFVLAALEVATMAMLVPTLTTEKFILNII